MTSYTMPDVPKPSEEGSEEAIQVLLKLKELDTFTTAETISALTGIPTRTLAVVLIGLHDRGRVMLDSSRTSWKVANQVAIPTKFRRA